MNKPKKPEKPKPKKPTKDFPLSPHASGSWCKKIRGKIHYFGGWSDPQGALEKYNLQKEDLEAGRVPRQVTLTPKKSGQGMTLEELCDTFIEDQHQRVLNGELAQRTFQTYHKMSQDLCDRLGKARLLTDILPVDLKQLRDQFAKESPTLTTLANKIRLVRVLLNYAFENDHVEKQFKLKNVLGFPPAKAVREEKNKRPLRMFSAEQIRAVLAIASKPLRAMTLLGINAGYGQYDISMLLESAVNLEQGWIDFPRPKTAVKRLTPLWPETAQALREVLGTRIEPTDDAAVGKVFVTSYGKPFVRSTEAGVQIDSVALEFGKLLEKTGVKVRSAKQDEQKGKGLNFYALRHTFQTIADDTLDVVGVKFLMGHTPKASDMSATYRQLIQSQRLQKITDYVRAWLFPEGTEEASLKADEERREAEAKAKKTTVREAKS